MLYTLEEGLQKVDDVLAERIDYLSYRGVGTNVHELLAEKALFSDCVVDISRNTDCKDDEEKEIFRKKYCDIKELFSKQILLIAKPR